MSEPVSQFGGSPRAEAHLFGPGKKKILTLDGGGVRGIVTIAFLQEMERQLREATGKPELVLSDVFDMIAGTSVGSMLATMLAMGREVEEIEVIFRELAKKIFVGRKTLIGPKRFNARPLVNGTRKIVKNETLGSHKLLTGLCIIAKRVDTGAPWVLSNNPKMPYFHDGVDFRGNKHYKLEKIIRASTAAPFLFTPTEIVINTDAEGEEDKGLFVDGGVSPHNNPALQMLMQAALPSYKLGWSLGADELLMISVGTGHHRTRLGKRKPVLSGIKAFLARRVDPDLPADINEAAFAAETLRGLISDSETFGLQILQSLSHPRFSWQINSEIGNLDGEFLLSMFKGMQNDDAIKSVFSFQRYNLPLEAGLVAPQFDIDAPKKERMGLTAIDDPSKIDHLHRLATQAASRQVSIKDFEGFL